KSPTVAKRIKEVLNESLPEELDETLDQINKLRNTLKGDFVYKVKKLNEVTAGLVDKELVKKEPVSIFSAKALSWIIWSTVIVFAAVIFFALWEQDPAFRNFVLDINPEFYTFLVAGFIFAMVDGAIGMSYGVTS